MATSISNTKPIIKAYEHIVSYKTDDNGIPKKTIDITKKFKKNKLKIKGVINGKPINISRKVRFPINLISPNKGAITSKKNSFVPQGILRYKKRKGIHNKTQRHH
jgi:hypothetical protein